MKVQLETLPLYSTTAKISKFFAYLIDDHWRCYIFLFLTLVLNALEIVFVISSDVDLTHLAVNLFLSVLWLATNIRVSVLIHNRKQMNEFLEEIHFLYMEIMENGDLLTKNLLKETTKSARRFANINYFLGFLCCVGMVFSSVLAKKREPIFDIYLPFYNDKKLESPCFEILFAIEFIFLPVGCFMFMTFINLIVALVVFNIFMCKVLKSKLGDLGDGKMSAVQKTKLIQCVNFHNTISYCIDRINSLTTYVFASEYILFGALMCVLLFLLILVKTNYEKVIMFSYIFMLFVQLFETYYFANILFFESLGVADAAYDTNWYLYNGRIRLNLMLLIQKSQKPICLTMGNFHPMKIDVLTKLINATYSFFAILSKMIK